ncbi:MAG: D-alanine--D-alanine ligase [Candidatus Lloydbacteria bacterium CG22_combo_CG10-13_8_21_14_all_47_15]|uniref:D-alanine--D-alanine ligase n=1 Tax=Candidatus Lloydbacteria bacterium CG22_combo_CG10-13_8_21_14_all_47_15 TaxID=1974635 RepID=A0A2H0CV95_9BACT|nr:MAG: D-alanine--D-alanine ligase [Candidatus Lloydbacteria bacterium CG22_combo_CG10-13_8_21_14_all_47_15]
MVSPRIGVLRGGPSGEYDVSLQTGAAILKNMPEPYRPVDILISKDGIWHMEGYPTEPARILPHLDAVWNALHGAYGEDGTVQRILDCFGMPYTGSGALASAIGMNKWAAKRRFADTGLRTPYAELISKDEYSDSREMSMRIFKKFPFPFVVKPYNGGSSLGVIIVRKFDGIAPALREVFLESNAALIEAYAHGKEATCGVVDNFRGEDAHALMPIEIIAPENVQFFDYGAKYSGETIELCPSPNFTQEEKKEIERMAVLAHKAIGARHYSRSDFIVSPRGIHILEINTLPGMTEASLLPKSLAAGGTLFPEFLEHILSLTLQK